MNIGTALLSALLFGSAAAHAQDTGRVPPSRSDSAGMARDTLANTTRSSADTVAPTRRTGTDTVAAGMPDSTSKRSTGMRRHRGMRRPANRPARSPADSIYPDSSARATPR